MVTAVANVTMRESKARSTMQKRAGHSLPRFIVSRSISNSDKTKWRIVGALEKALKKKPFNKVNVVDMTDECHIARQTFYNHFLDKQDVVNWLNMQLDMKTLGRIGIDLTWREAVRMKLEIMKAKQHLFSSMKLRARWGSSATRRTSRSRITLPILPALRARRSIPMNPLS